MSKKISAVEADWRAAVMWIKGHKLKLRSKNKRVRARAQKVEREIKRLDREISSLLSPQRGR